MLTRPSKTKRITEACARRFWIGTSGVTAPFPIWRSAGCAVIIRFPGLSKLDLMITLCTRCHAIVERTQIVLGNLSRCSSFCGGTNIHRARSSFICLRLGIAESDGEVDAPG